MMLKIRQNLIINLSLLKGNPYMTTEELTSRMNNLIQESISLNESQNVLGLHKTK